MTEMLADLEGVIVHIDDVLVYGKTQENTTTDYMPFSEGSSQQGAHSTKTSVNLARRHSPSWAMS